VLLKVAKEAVRRTWFHGSVYAFLELFGGIYIALLVSSIATPNALSSKGIDVEIIVAGSFVFLIRTALSMGVLRKMLLTSFEISRDLIIDNFRALLNVGSARDIEIDRFVKNISHEILSLQANGTTPIIFLISDIQSIILLVGAALYYSIDTVVYFILFSGITAGIGYKVSKHLPQIADIRAINEESKLSLARSLGRSRVLYQASEAGDKFLEALSKYTEASSISGAKHQSITQAPRLLVEIVLVISLTIPLYSGYPILENQIIAFVILVRTIPSFIRVLYNQANIKVAKVSSSIIEQSLRSSYVAKMIKTEIEIRNTSDKLLEIKCDDRRYLSRFYIERGVTIISGPSGFGKTVLMRNLVDQLNQSGIDSFFLSREMINDEIAMRFLAIVIRDNLRNENNDLTAEIEVIVKNAIEGEKISTGESERLILYFASGLTCKVLVLDEYFLNVPDSDKNRYVELFLLRRRLNYTLLITHDSFLLSNRALNVIKVIND